MPELRNRLVVGAELFQQPHQVDIPMGFLLQTTARTQAVEIAVNIQLQEIAGIVRRASGRGSCDTVKAQSCKIEFVDKGINEADGVLFCNIVIEALRKEDLLMTVHALDMTHNSTKLQKRGLQSDVLDSIDS